MVIEAVAVVLLSLAAVAWYRVGVPLVVEDWIAFARDLDPTWAPQHATLFARATPPRA